MKSESQQSESGKYYPYIDGWRGVSILWILWHHVQQFFDTRGLFGLFEGILLDIGRVGNLGVDLFFVISGFSITGILLRDLDQGKIRVGRFYARRFSKIVPQYLLVVIVGLLFNALAPPFDVGGMSSHNRNASAISYFFFFQNYTTPVPALAHTWFLAVVWHFYLLYPLLMKTICIFEKDGKSRRRILSGICIFVILWINTMRYLDPNRDFLALLFKAPGPYLTSAFRMDAIMFGCLLNLLEPYYCSRKGKGWKFLSIFCFVLGASVYAGWVHRGFFEWNRWYSYPLAYLAPGALLIACMKGDSNPLRIFIENPFLRWLGRNSYGIFLWHFILIFPFGLLGTRYGPIMIPFFLLSSIIAGTVSMLTIGRWSREALPLVLAKNLVRHSP